MRKKKTALLSYNDLVIEPERDLPSDFFHVFRQHLHHIKFVCTPEQNLWAKAYLSIDAFALHYKHPWLRSVLEVGSI